ncbi:type I restriction-modification system subunit M [Dictyobacter vulcani]|uniref:type I restriction-modification system subunit M n=1 Tax=Dictyobacter vulcani TaxID=2607529 RepID=UPI0018E9A9E5|nr:class I SAM-dependent DNA methyltransferase [Dictyobacter vulcani]
MLPDIFEIENRLWESADALRANTHLRASEYSVPVLGLIFLKFADNKFQKVKAELEAEQEPGSRYIPGPPAYHARGAIYLEPEAQYDYLLGLTDNDQRPEAVNKAMTLIEAKNPDLSGSLPTQGYTNLDNRTLGGLLRGFSIIPFDPDMEGDPFGRIYEYFLSKFALKEGQHGGEFYTPTSLVKLIVEIIEPFQGMILDPACGSGGMFVQSAQFVREHNREGNPNRDISIYGQEKTLGTARLCKMNLAVHGLAGDIKDGNSYYEDHHDTVGRFDYVMANPPFNVNGVEKARLDKSRYPFGVPRVDNGNYLWIQMFYSALKKTGRAGFVMPNSASDARSSEQEVRQHLIEDYSVDVMISVGSNFFYTVTLPCTLWFLDKGKRDGERRDRVLFIDARDIFHQIDRAHREFTPEQIEYIANIVRLYRGEQPEYSKGSEGLVKANFPDGVYVDIAGRCKVASIEEIKKQGWSLNPGRYVGVAERAPDDFIFKEKLQELNEELETLNTEAHNLEAQISEDVNRLLEEDEE